MMFPMYKGLTEDMFLSPQQRITLLLWIIINFLAITVVGIFTIDTFIIYEFPQIVIGMLALVFIFFLLAWLLSIIFKKHKETIVFNLLMIMIVLWPYTVYKGLQLPTLKELTIPSIRMPANLPEFRIVQLSDLHLGGVVTPPWMDQVIDQVNRLKPDLIVFTGDFVEGLEPIKAWDPFKEGLRQLRAKYGIYAISGNHDLIKGWRAYSRFCKDCNIKTLVNESVLVGGMINLVGINDPLGMRLKNHGGPNFVHAFEKVDFTKPVVFLSHRPDYFEISKKYNIDLQLSGHTHNGQLPPMSTFVEFYYRYPYGLYQAGNSYTYTTSGASVIRVPMRLFTQNEIVLVHLVKK